MTEEQMEEVFSYYGYDDLYKRFKYPLYVSGLLDDVEEEQLEDFFEEFTIEHPHLFFDEFKYWLSYFLVFKKNFS
ncbi:hypothetical protein WAK64_16300 [Bacillus spongiae]|uniref:Uncharacterized protein n=1 Tax=Bacillus spongiae TaxID=2683610 RepID=A0ABU8HGW9_9BACI